MALQTGTDKIQNSFNVAQQESKTSALDWAVFGCLIAGAVGIIKALGADSPFGVLLCLLGSVAAFGLIIYLHLRKS